MMPDRRRYLARCIGSLGGLAVGSFCLAQTQTDNFRRQLRFTVSLTNPGAQALERQVLWLYMPVAETATQKLVELKVSMPYELSSDTLQHSIAKLAFARFEPWASKVIGFVADVTMTSAPSSVALTDARPWLRAERFIEVDEPRIRALAIELKRSTALDTAHAIYAWVLQNLQYAGYIADDLGALEALLNRRGDCTEYACLAVALARANGIPARMVGGYVTDHSVTPRAEDYHNWAEVYLDGAWRLLDAQKAHWLSPAEQYVAFRIYRDERTNPIGLAHRFKMDGGLQVRM